MSTESIRELATVPSTGCRWRPEWLEDGEASRLLHSADLPTSAFEAIRRDTVEVLARCKNPVDSDDGHETGLVVGYVQSGKTLSFTAVAALAADNGFPIVIVLSGTKLALTQQTVKRLRRDLRVDEPGSRWNLFEGGTTNPHLAQQLRQLLGLWDQGDPFYPAKATLIVLLKNKQRVKSLAETLQDVELAGRPCLIIDDEADEHGLNTRIQAGEFSPTYSSILELRASVPNHTYLQYTATPQANVLISVLDSLSPSFGWVLTPGDDYTGGRAFFGGAQDLIKIIPDDDLAVATAQHLADDPPESLLVALRRFFVGAAAQACNRREGRPSQNLRSMLIHPSMQKLDHFRFRTWVERIKERWIGLLDNGDDEDRIEELALFREAWQDLFEAARNHPDTEYLPPFEEIEPRLLGALRATPPTWEVNSRDAAAKWDHTNWSLGPSHILVGGENLGRGFTVEGLTVTYMPRGSGQRQVDTIEQRARFFGYKRPYLGLCRVFLAPEVRDIYTEYLEHEDYLISKLRDLADAPDTSMKDWRRAMILATSVQPTRPRVLPPGFYKQLKVKPWTKHEYPLSVPQQADFSANRVLVDEFTSRFAFEDDSSDSNRTTEQIHGIARNIPLQTVLEDLLIPFAQPVADSFRFSGLELVLGYHLSRHQGATATILRMSHRADPHDGGGHRDRTAKATNNYRINPSQGWSKNYPGDETIHGEVTTVQVHDIDIRGDSGELLQGNVPLLAVWVPESIRHGVLMED